MFKASLRLTITIVVIGLSYTSLRAQDNVMTNSGSWSTGGNWSQGHMPTNTETAIINTNISVISGLPVAYTGDLVLREGAQLDFGISSTVFIQDIFPSGASSEVHCYQGSLIEMRFGTAAKPIVLHGNLTIQHQNQAKLTYTSPFSDGPGSVGSLTIQRQGDWGSRALQFSPSSSSTYSGGTTIEPHPSAAAINIVWVDQNNAFGTGDVTINGAAAAMTLDLNGATTNVIDDSATLHMVGSARLDLNNDSETVSWLFIDGVQQATGTWGTTGSGAAHTNDAHFAGSGMLTVTGGADSSPPWPNPMTFTARPLTTTSVVATATTAVDVNAVSYLFTNDTTGASSGWQSGVAWTNAVSIASVNAYRVKAKDTVGNETLWSSVFTQSPFTYNTMTNSGTWATAGNWSLGHMPAGGETAIIDTDVTVTYSTGHDAYTGDLIMREAASIDTGWNGHIVDYFPSGPASVAHFYEGSLIELRDGNIALPITLHGHFTLQHLDQQALTVSAPISGSGSMTYQRQGDLSGRALTIAPASPSTYTGGTIIEPHPSAAANNILWVSADGAFGTGDVTINGRSNAVMTVILNGSTTDIIDDTAALYMVGVSKLNLNDDSETVSKLFIDGEPQIEGTWGSSSSPAENPPDDAHFLGTGVLTVLDTSLPPSGSVLVVR